MNLDLLLRNPKEVFNLDIEEGNVSHISTDKNHIFAGIVNGAVVFDKKTGNNSFYQLPFDINDQSKKYVCSIKKLKDIIFAGTNDQKLYFLDLKDAEQVKSRLFYPLGSHDGNDRVLKIETVKHPFSGKDIIACLTDNGWYLSSKIDDLHNATVSAKEILKGSISSYYSHIFDDRYVYFSASHLSMIGIIDLTDGRIIKSIYTEKLARETNRDHTPHGIAFDRDNVYCCRNSDIIILDRKLNFQHIIDLKDKKYSDEEFCFQDMVIDEDKNMLIHDSFFGRGMIARDKKTMEILWDMEDVSGADFIDNGIVYTRGNKEAQGFVFDIDKCDIVSIDAYVDNSNKLPQSDKGLVNISDELIEKFNQSEKNSVDLRHIPKRYSLVVSSDDEKQYKFIAERPRKGKFIFKDGSQENVSVDLRGTNQGGSMIALDRVFTEGYLEFYKYGKRIVTEMIKIIDVYDEKDNLITRLS